VPVTAYLFTLPSLIKNQLNNMQNFHYIMNVCLFALTLIIHFNIGFQVVARLPQK
jgi:hypothetical protein